MDSTPGNTWATDTFAAAGRAGGRSPAKPKVSITGTSSRVSFLESWCW
jgi:hypothetical protein